MANINVKVLQEFLTGGAVQAVDAVISIDETLAKQWVYEGKVEYVTAPESAAEITPGINGILTAQIKDAGAVGGSILKSANLAAVLIAMGVTLGAADSGGTGFKALRVPNA